MTRVVLNGLRVVGKIVNLRSLKLERTFQLNDLPFRKKNLGGLPTLTIFPTTISNYMHIANYAFLFSLLAESDRCLEKM